VDTGGCPVIGAVSRPFHYVVVQRDVSGCRGQGGDELLDDCSPEVEKVLDDLRLESDLIE